MIKLNTDYGIDFTIDLYGIIKEDIKEEIERFFESIPNANIKGFNDASYMEDYYKVLNTY